MRKMRSSSREKHKGRRESILRERRHKMRGRPIGVVVTKASKELIKHYQALTCMVSTFVFLPWGVIL